MKTSGIYKIQSKIKPIKIYIGSAVNISARWGEHLRTLKNQTHKSKKLQNHFNKYGKADLQFSILLGCEVEDLIKTEQYFIDFYNPWFNTCKIAGSQLGLKRSKESKKRMSVKHMGLKTALGYKHSEEAKIKMKGRNVSEETRKKISVGNKGRKASFETRQKMSISFTGRKYASPRPKEVYDKIANKRRGQKMSAEFCKRNSEMRLGVKRGKYKKRNPLIQNNI
jgi:group I intron endonuclease